MNGGTSKGKCLWEDKFHAPSIDSLLAGINRQHLAWIEHIRKTLSEVPGVSERLGWEGVALKWAISFRSRECGERPICYLVPQPGHPKMVIPLPLEVLANINAGSVPKWLRDGVLQAPLVARVRWTQWELSGKNQIEELLELVMLRLPAVTSRAGI